jgi:UDP-N-acetylglucosamine 4,6-dehydratase
MISRDESRSTIELDEMFVVEPQSALWFRYDWTLEGKKVPDGFKYSSDKNSEWYTLDQIKILVAPFEEAYRQGKHF